MSHILVLRLDEHEEKGLRFSRFASWGRTVDTHWTGDKIVISYSRVLEKPIMAQLAEKFSRPI
jgi:hypothetical protein